MEILFTGVLPAGWVRGHWRGAPYPHIGRRWDALDPGRPAHVQRRCSAEVTLREDGTIWWSMLAEDGPRQYNGWANGTAPDVDHAVAYAEAKAVAWMDEPVAYPRLLRCPATGRPCADGPCRTPWSGCDGLRSQNRSHPSDDPPADDAREILVHKVTE